MNITSARIACATATVALLVSCGNDTPGKPTTTSQASASSAASATATSTSTSAAAFDPCTALTTQLLSQHQWNARPPAQRQDQVGGFTWKGCLYVAQTTYTFRVQTSNATLAQVREKFPSAADLTIGGRKALRYEARPDVPGGCTLNIEMKSGSLSILVDDPRGVHPRKLSPCDNAKEIAEAVAPLLPAGS
ncbi:DUF3558 domain-containing protein [Nocardia sp. XZ_19_385]|uniref:DUF3558 domain-containing protein n=1 Tax=Nocardia sp. XZ_19_385 TaxID=2769488 RepID=UPI00188FA7E2|nr:DUF3558 domain-containing protein [Nocardia sp. XZ_19_385]